ncbi:Uu.00g124340.m01.CDS01 [Anthostomella pinea]|uniref:Uu.00g124340.m01.CDS01 n=1 Tax=Anthostomella pinea TaxID=933095 RepID=A0AAI8YHH4_9PEZI|nr:Uu.00g124340.m01.CDS01 [Anthostomella pinea]
MIVSPFRPRTTLLAAGILAPLAYFLLYHLRPAWHNDGFDFHRLDYHDLADYPYPAADASTKVHLVVASTQEDDIDWVWNLRVPNMQVIRYVSDNASAHYHPPVAKGREALMYFRYISEFYDALPDISIFIHAHERPWHMDPALHQSMTFALSRLDLQQVKRRGYYNLRTNWQNACPDWINTTKTAAESVKQEEPWVKGAFQATFGDGVEVPEILAGPCCSQFAVTREAIRSRPREQYERAERWLVATGWTDYIVGRVWEHLWPYLFMGKSVDCALEYRSFCRFYGVCFEGPERLAEYNDVWDKREQWRESTEFLREVWRPARAGLARAVMAKYTLWLEDTLAAAVERGKSMSLREQAWEDTTQWIPR